MKILIILLMLCSVCYGGELRQNALPDYKGDPVYTFYSDNGDSYEIRERGLKDMWGNPIYDIDEPEDDDCD